MSTQNSATRIDTNDVAELSDLMRPWDVVLRQASPGQFHSRIDAIQVNGIIAYRERQAVRELGTGATPAGYFLFGGPLPGCAHPQWCGSPLNGQRLGFSAPGRQVDFIVPDAADHLVVLVPTELMRHYFGDETIDTALTSNHHTLASSHQDNFNLVAYVAQNIDRTIADPAMATDRLECAAFESQLLDRLAAIFDFSATDRDLATPRQRRAAFLRAVEYSEGINRHITVPELATAIGASSRTVRRAFEESLGVSPQKFLRRQRMQRTHDELLKCNGESTTVTQAATRWGFSELGRFAAEYTSYFGEYPSQTLKRRQSKVSGGIADIRGV